MIRRQVVYSLITFFIITGAMAQLASGPGLLTIDQIYASSEFRGDYFSPFQWVENGDAYARVEYDEEGRQQLVKYRSDSGESAVVATSEELTPAGSSSAISVENFSFSSDESKLLLFTNSARVWRSNTKGDYWVLDLASKKLKQIGADLPASSLMFAKFSADNSSVAYVSDFNLYVEDATSGEVSQLTSDGDGDIINGTFDWAYEEEFGNRDGFRWSPGGGQIAFWQLDASSIGTFYMINNTDSIYSRPIPIQYPKVGEDPSACKVGLVNTGSGEISWIPLEGSQVQNYIPAMQWIDANSLLIQQLNRHQNNLIVWHYDVTTQALRKVYEEKEDTWVDINYMDPSSNSWGKNDLRLVDDGKYFLRMTEGDGWRHLYKVEISSGEKTLLTPGDYDVASMAAVTDKHAYFHASPDNSTQRYLYRVDLRGRGKLEKITPDDSQGMNLYNCAPNGEYAVHRFSSVLEPETVSMVSLPDHKTQQVFLDNEDLKGKLAALKMPTSEFTKVTTAEGIEIDVRVIKPHDFDPAKEYPVLFHVYGEPAGQVAVDRWVGMWTLMLAQQGYVVVDMDNRGTPCLKGSEWRKSIYRQIGRINVLDQAQAAREVLKFDYIDPDRTAVWGWSGGGSMTLNLMFQYPETYTTGMSVAPVPNQLLYDNIYQERFMGLPQENEEDFLAGSPVTYAKNLEGNLLIVHGTGDDNVHYQGTEVLINELIAQNKQFDVMVYPNRSHGIYEGPNTRRHLFTMLTNYLIEHVEAGGR